LFDQYIKILPQPTQLMAVTISLLLPHHPTGNQYPLSTATLDPINIRQGARDGN